MSLWNFVDASKRALNQVKQLKPNLDNLCDDKQRADAAAVAAAAPPAATPRGAYTPKYSKPEFPSLPPAREETVHHSYGMPPPRAAAPSEKDHKPRLGTKPLRSKPPRAPAAGKSPPSVDPFLADLAAAGLGPAPPAPVPATDAASPSPPRPATLSPHSQSSHASRQSSTRSADVHVDMGSPPEEDGGKGDGADDAGLASNLTPLWTPGGFSNRMSALWAGDGEPVEVRDMAELAVQPRLNPRSELTLALQDAAMPSLIDAPDDVDIPTLPLADPAPRPPSAASGDGSKDEDSVVDYVKGVAWILAPCCRGVCLSTGRALGRCMAGVAALPCSQAAKHKIVAWSQRASLTQKGVVAMFVLLAMVALWYVFAVSETVDTSVVEEQQVVP